MSPTLNGRLGKRLEETCAAVKGCDYGGLYRKRTVLSICVGIFLEWHRSAMVAPADFDHSQCKLDVYVAQMHYSTCLIPFLTQN